MRSSLASIERFLDSLLGKNRGDLVLCVCWTSPVEILFDALESVLCYTVISDCFIQANCYGFSCAENECKKGRMEWHIPYASRLVYKKEIAGASTQCGVPVYRISRGEERWTY